MEPFPHSAERPIPRGLETHSWIAETAEDFKYRLEKRIRSNPRSDSLYLYEEQERTAMLAVCLARVLLTRPGELLWNMAQLCAKESRLCIYRTDLVYHDINYIRRNPEARFFMWFATDTHSFITRIPQGDQVCPDEGTRLAFYLTVPLGGSLVFIDTATGILRDLDYEMGMAMLMPIPSINPVEYERYVV